MLTAPQIIQTEVQHAAIIHLAIPRNEMRKVFGPAVGELMAALADQKAPPVGAVFAHHLKMSQSTFDFELGVTVSALEREHKAVFVVNRLEIDYLLPARLYDALDATLSPVERGGARLVLAQDVLRGPDLIASARVSLATPPYQSKKKRSYPTGLDSKKSNAAPAVIASSSADTDSRPRRSRN